MTTLLNFLFHLHNRRNSLILAFNSEISINIFIHQVRFNEMSFLLAKNSNIINSKARTYIYRTWFFHVCNGAKLIYVFPSCCYSATHSYKKASMWSL